MVQSIPKICCLQEQSVNFIFIWTHTYVNSYDQLSFKIWLNPKETLSAAVLHVPESLNGLALFLIIFDNPNNSTTAFYADGIALISFGLSIRHQKSFFKAQVVPQQKQNRSN